MFTGETLNIRLIVQLEAFGGARQQLKNYCAGLGISDLVRDRLILLLEELFSNVVMHSQQAKVVDVKITSHAKYLKIKFTDDGGEFDLFAEDISSLDDEFEDRPVGKLGLPLIRALTTSGEYLRVDGQNHLILELPM